MKNYAQRVEDIKVTRKVIIMTMMVMHEWVVNLYNLKLKLGGK